MKFLIRFNSNDNNYLNSLYSNHSVKYKEDSGLDLFIPEDTLLLPGETTLVDLGIQCQLRSIETNFWKWFMNGHIYRYHSYNMYPRSSISKSPLFLANSVGLCDAAYLGNLKAALHNRSKNEVVLKKGERYVQLARSDLGIISFEIVQNLRNTERGSSGFGSSGK
jgi:dUTP pyrophosphatase